MNSNYSQKDVVLPLNQASVGRLIFEGGAANLTIRTDATLSVLCKAEFEGFIPECVDEGGDVVVRYSRSGLRSWLSHAWEQTGADIVLKGGIPWEIRVGGGIARMDADLREIQLKGFQVGGGISRGLLRLGEPVGEVPLHIGGGISNLAIARPEDSPLRCRIKGGVAGMVFDAHTFGGLGGGSSFETSNFSTSSNHFTLDIEGGASKLILESLSEAEERMIEERMKKQRETISGYEIIRA